LGQQGPTGFGLRRLQLGDPLAFLSQLVGQLGSSRRSSSIPGSSFVPGTDFGKYGASDRHGSDPHAHMAWNEHGRTMWSFEPFPLLMRQNLKTLPPLSCVHLHQMLPHLLIAYEFVTSSWLSPGSLVTKLTLTARAACDIMALNRLSTSLVNWLTLPVLGRSLAFTGHTSGWGEPRSFAHESAECPANAHWTVPVGQGPPNHGGLHLCPRTFAHRVSKEVQ
jgi:hypothetical protein